jgi:hypothetical protein
MTLGSAVLTAMSRTPGYAKMRRRGLERAWLVLWLALGPSRAGGAGLYSMGDTTGIGSSSNQDYLGKTEGCYNEFDSMLEVSDQMIDLCSDRFEQL